MIRILLADDQERIRHGFRLILDAQPDMQVVGEAADGLTAEALARRLRPDVVLADIRMPRLDGLELTRRLAGPEAVEPVRVIVVTTFDLDDYVHAALRNGACGFLLKRAGSDAADRGGPGRHGGRHAGQPLDHRTAAAPSHRARGERGGGARRAADRARARRRPVGRAMAGPTPRSAPSCSSPPGPPRRTSRTSSASSALATASASRRGRGAPASSTPDRSADRQIDAAAHTRVSAVADGRRRSTGRHGVMGPQPDRARH